MLQRAVALGFQAVVSPATATGLTIPVGAQQAEGTSCTLSGSLLTVGGTVTGVFAVGQTVQGTGIPPNTLITRTGSTAATWWLSNPCSTESGETVIANQTLAINLAIIRCTGGNVNWRDDGVAPTATVGMPMLATDSPFEYMGDIGGIQFIEQSGAATVDVSFYSLSG